MTENTGSARVGLAAALRVVSALVVVGSAVAVTALSSRGDDQVTVVVPQSHAAAVQPAAAGPAIPVPPARPGVRGSVLLPGSVPIGSAVKLALPAPAIAVQTPALSKPGTSPAGSTPISPGSAASPSLFGAAPITPQPKCPLGWPAPTSQGGLASLIGLAPLAGPFSSEAFALGTVYQPLLQLVGPVLAEISPVIGRYQPVIDPVIQNVQGAEAVVLQAILPYYGPYRGQLIAAEGDVAKAITPILDRVYNSEPAACFVAWQGQIIAQAKGGPFTVPSLAHPGSVVELGPR